MATIPPALPAAFTLAQAREAGLSKKRVYALLERGQLALVSRGVRDSDRYVRVTTLEPPNEQT